MNDRGTATEHHVDDELPGYALDALDPPEQSIVARHLHVCPRCRQLAESARTLAAQLAFAAPPRRPPADLRERVLARAAQEPHGAAVGADRRAASPSPRESRAPRLLSVPPMSLIAADASVAAGLGARRRVPAWVMMAASLPIVLLAGVALGWTMASQAPVRRTPLTVVSVRGSGGIGGVQGHLIMFADQSTASLVLTHLPPLAPNHTYVCWLQHDRTMEHACAFHLPPRDDDVSVLLHSTLPMGRYVKVAVAAEPSAHPARPSGTFLASASLP